MKINAVIAANELGINRKREGDLAPMVKALGMVPWLNTPEDERRREVAKWAIKNWCAYQVECNNRRELNRSK
jgi:hypothetical protein